MSSISNNTVQMSNTIENNDTLAVIAQNADTEALEKEEVVQDTTGDNLLQETLNGFAIFEVEHCFNSLYRRWVEASITEMIEFGESTDIRRNSTVSSEKLEDKDQEEIVISSNDETAKETFLKGEAVTMTRCYIGMNCSSGGNLSHSTQHSRERSFGQHIIRKVVNEPNENIDDNLYKGGMKLKRNGKELSLVPIKMANELEKKENKVHDRKANLGSEGDSFVFSRAALSLEDVLHLHKGWKIELDEKQCEEQKD